MHLVLAVLLVLWTTARHEASHALVAWLEGATIQAIRLLPGFHPDLGFYFGYVIHSGDTTWWTDAAPFLVDTALLSVAAVVLVRGPALRHRRRFVMFAVLSPLADLAYAYQGGLWRPGTDVFDLFAALPDPLVHVGFLGAIIAAICLLRIGHSGRATAAMD